MKDLGRAEEIIERFDLDPFTKIKKMSKRDETKDRFGSSFIA